MAFTFDDVFVGRNANTIEVPGGGLDIEHYDPDGIFIETLTIPIAASTVARVGGMTIGLDGQLYVLYQTSAGTTVDHIGVFNAGGVWVGDLVDIDTLIGITGISTTLEFIGTASNGDLIFTVTEGGVGEHIVRIDTGGMLISDVYADLTPGGSTPFFFTGPIVPGLERLFQLTDDGLGGAYVSEYDVATGAIMANHAFTPAAGDTKFDYGCRPVFFQSPTSSPADYDSEVMNTSYVIIETHPFVSLSGTIVAFGAKVNNCGSLQWVLTRVGSRDLYRVDLSDGSRTLIDTFTPGGSIHGVAARIEVPKDPLFDCDTCIDVIPFVTVNMLGV